MSNYYCNCECGGVDPAPEIMKHIETLEQIVRIINPCSPCVYKDSILDIVTTALEASDEPK